MKQNLIYLFFFSALFFSCKNSKLSRDSAEELIKKKFEYPTFQYSTINTREKANTGVIWVYVDEECGTEKVEDYNKGFKVGNQLRKLQNAGLITINEADTHEDFGGSMFGYWPDGHPYLRYSRTYFNDAVFTKKALPYVEGDRVRVAETNFGKITGVVENSPTSARVDFTETENITPFGGVLDYQGGTNKRTITFVRYDDGWRIEN